MNTTRGSCRLATFPLFFPQPFPIPRYFVHLAYRGTHYRGWQRQSGAVPTVQGTIERAGSQVGASERGEALRVVGCGRTDAGVHASDYYLHFDAAGPLRDRWVWIMNRNLPDDIVLYRAWSVAPNAHTRYDARERTYDYYLHTRADPFLAVTSSLYPGPPPDVDAIQTGLSLLTGHRDFRAFCLTPDRHNTTDCDLRQASFHQEGPGRFRFRFVANRFLRGMIRILVHQLLQIGRSEATPAHLTQALRTGRRTDSRQAAPEGLILSQVTY